MKRETLAAVKRIDLVEFLISLGHKPVKIVGNDYWFLAPGPDRNEKTASFKVNRLKNLWFDHGVGKGGTNIDFCINCLGDTFSQAVARLENYLSFHQPSLPITPMGHELPVGPVQAKAGMSGGEKRKIIIISAGPLSAETLIRYAGGRGISPDLLQQYCEQVVYELGGRRFFAIGFPNARGGYELRSAHFKGSSSPKASTFIDNGAQEVAVFEGFFSFLSFLAFNPTLEKSASNFLVLNSLSFLEMGRPIMETHHRINLYLDRDAAGIKRTLDLVASSSLYNDCSSIYQGHKDFNEWLLHLQKSNQALDHARKISTAKGRSSIPGEQSRGHRL